MNKPLIKISKREGQQVVSARELHSFLDVETPFRKWIERMFDYGFEENEDFVRADKNVRQVSGSKNLKEYALTLDCAKEISMIQRNDKGKQARKYFIEVEKSALNQVSVTDPLELLRLAVSELEKKDQEIKFLRPKAELMEKVLDTDEKIDIGQAAKILELPFGRNTMFKELREKGVFFKNRNEPKQEYIKRKFFVLKEKYITRNNHDGFVVIKVLVTQKGLEFLSGLFQSVYENKKLAKLN